MLPRKTPRRQSLKRTAGKSKPTSKAKPTRHYIFVGGQKMASVVGDELQQSRDGSRHFLHHPQAIAFSGELLRKAQRFGAVRVCITDRETGRTYRTSVGAILEHGFPVYRGTAEPQVALPLHMWTVTELKNKAGGQPQRAPQCESRTGGVPDGQPQESGAEAVNGRQLGLFGEAGR